MRSQEREQLRKEWLDAKSALQKAVQLEKEREELEEQVQKLALVVDEEAEALHRLRAAHSPEAEALEQLRDTHAAELGKLRREKRALDEELDHIEELSDEDAALLESDLAKAIVAQDPESEVQYKKYTAGLETLSHSLSLMDKVLENSAKLEELIAIILKERRKVSRMGILAYIFGASPNYVISRALQEIEKITKAARKDLEAIDTEGADLRFLEICKKEKECLAALSEFCREPWNFSKIDRAIPEQETLQKGFSALAIRQKEQLLQEKLKLEEALYQWLISK